ncbi:MAG: ABC transporter permease [Actinomycetota bacterium]|nr:ABC transporter permease [Actinomycetota bacterium]
MTGGTTTVKIPDYGGPPGGQKGCIAQNGTFCWEWVQGHWSDILQPRLLEHLELTAIAVSIGFVIAFAAALLAHRQGWFETPFSTFSAFLYTIPSLALFQLLVPFTGLTMLTIEIGLVGYTLLILFRNILVGLRSTPPDVLEAARGMGLTRIQRLTRIELPLAVPAISAGIRIAVVSTISLATVAAYITPLGLGQPIFYGLQTNFTTEFVATGALAIALAIVADGLLVVAQRAVTPWARARRATA